MFSMVMGHNGALHMFVKLINILGGLEESRAKLCSSP